MVSHDIGYIIALIPEAYAVSENGFHYMNNLLNCTKTHHKPQCISESNQSDQDQDHIYGEK